MRIPSFNTIASTTRQVTNAVKPNYVSSGMLGARSENLAFSIKGLGEKLKGSKFGKWAQNFVDGINKKLHLDKVKEFAGKQIKNLKEGFSKLAETGIGKKITDGFKAIKDNKFIKGVTNWVSEKFTAIKENKTVKTLCDAVKDFFKKPGAKA